MVQQAARLAVGRGAAGTHGAPQGWAQVILHKCSHLSAALNTEEERTLVSWKEPRSKGYVYIPASSLTRLQSLTF
jgi:hypothetical protein